MELQRGLSSEKGSRCYATDNLQLLQIQIQNQRPKLLSKMNAKILEANVLRFVLRMSRVTNVGDHQRIVSVYVQLV